MFFLITTISNFCRWKYIISVLVLVAFLTEIVQYFIPYRSFEWMDFFADVLGIFSFHLIAFIVKTLAKQKSLE